MVSKRACRGRTDSPRARKSDLLPGCLQRPSDDIRTRGPTQKDSADHRSVHPRLGNPLRGHVVSAGQPTEPRRRGHWSVPFDAEHVHSFLGFSIGSPALDNGHGPQRSPGASSLHSVEAPSNFRTISGSQAPPPASRCGTARPCGDGAAPGARQHACHLLRLAALPGAVRQQARGEAQVTRGGEDPCHAVLRNSAPELLRAHDEEITWFGAFDVGFHVHRSLTAERTPRRARLLRQGGLRIRRAASYPTRVRRAARRRALVAPAFRLATCTRASRRRMPRRPRRARAASQQSWEMR